MIEKKIEKIETIRILEIYILGPKEANWVIEFLHQAKTLEDVLKELLEIRGKVIELETKVIAEADKIASQKWLKILSILRGEKS